MAKTKEQKKDDLGNQYSSWIRMGEDFKDMYSADWDRLYSYWDTPHVSSGYKDSVMSEDGKGFKTPYNVIWLNWKNLTAVLSSGDPAATVEPMGDGLEQSAKLLESVMNYFFRTRATKLEFKMIIEDALTTNLAYFKQGYFVEFKKSAGEKGPDAVLRKSLQDERIDKETLNKKVIDSISDYDDSAELMLDEVPDSETWYGERVDNENILVPPTAKYNLDKAPWMIHKLFKTSYEAKKSFPMLQQNKYVPTKTRNFGTDEHPVEVDVFEIYEIWDKTNPADKKVIYFVAQQDSDEGDITYEELKILDWPVGLDGFPISRLSFTLSPRKFYLPPDTYMYEHIAQALSEITSTQMGNQRRYRRRYGFNVNKVKQDQLELIAYGPDGVYFQAEDESAVWTLDDKMPQLDFGFYNLLVRMVGEFSGVDEFNRGSSSRTETATEASYVRSGSRLRLEDMVECLYDFMDDVFTKMGGLIQAHMTGPLQVKIDPDTMQALGVDSPFKDVTKEEIEGNFRYKIRAGTIARETNEEKKRKYFDFYNLVANDPYFEPVKVRRTLVERWLDEKSPDDFLKVGLAGQTSQAIMLEHTLAMKGIPIPDPNPMEDHAAHAQAHQQFLMTPPEEIKQQMASIQNNPTTTEPGAEQQVVGKWQQMQQLVQQHLEVTRQYLTGGTGSASGQAQDYNAAESTNAEGRESPETPRNASTTVQLGAIGG